MTNTATGTVIAQHTPRIIKNQINNSGKGGDGGIDEILKVLDSVQVPL